MPFDKQTAAQAGRTSAARMSPEKRRQRAILGAKTRWGERKQPVNVTPIEALEALCAFLERHNCLDIAFSRGPEAARNRVKALMAKG